MVNAARDARRAHRDDCALDELTESTSNGYPSAAGERVRGVVVALPPQQRLTVFLRYYADLDYATIAEVLGLSPGTVAATLHKAHGAIRRALDEEVVPCRTS